MKNKKRDTNAPKWGRLPANDTWLLDIAPGYQLRLTPIMKGGNCKLLRQDDGHLYSVIYAFQLNNPSASLKEKKRLAEKIAREYLNPTLPHATPTALSLTEKGCNYANTR